MIVTEALTINYLGGAEATFESSIPTTLQQHISLAQASGLEILCTHYPRSEAETDDMHDMTCL